MILTTIEEKNGIINCKTIVECDICKTGFEWVNNSIMKIPRGYTVKYIMRREGWKFEKNLHKCNKCRLK